MNCLITTLLAAVASQAPGSSVEAQHVDRPAPVVTVPESKAEWTAAVTVPVFTENWCHITRPLNIQRGHLTRVDTVECAIRFGSAFAYKSGDRVVLVTAAHVMPDAGSISELAAANGKVYTKADNYTIEQGPCKIRIGGVAIKPTRVIKAAADDELDVALMEIDSEDLSALNLEVLVAGPVKLGEEGIWMWGFPALHQSDAEGKPMPSVPNASQTAQASKVTEVRPREVVCTPLNGKETRGGFSGGPVLNAKGQVVGMITRSTAETTRCCAMPAIDKLVDAFKATDDVKSGKAKPAVNAPQVVDYTDPPKPKV